MTANVHPSQKDHECHEFLLLVLPSAASIRLTDQLRQLVPAWRWAPVGAALQALRGVSLITAVVLVAELGDLTRFDHPREWKAAIAIALTGWLLDN